MNDLELNKTKSLSSGKVPLHSTKDFAGFKTVVESRRGDTVTISWLQK